jgi:hypothetical protein
VNARSACKTGHVSAIIYNDLRTHGRKREYTLNFLQKIARTCVLIPHLQKADATVEKVAGKRNRIPERRIRYSIQPR